ncbi:hypothetical protein D8779_11385 [Pseudomonas leptonychotis]|uniref:DUF998 domain-containing protein n=2 Tax=Pseudomonas leptonychotis TaxID=2448482 RepID=A0A4T1ZUU4_9PSED|nr:hypothetical protein D8779_11385 [Pseudomonas leptonychotis]
MYSVAIGLMYSLSALAWLLFWRRSLAMPALLQRYPLLQAPWLGGALVQLVGAALVLHPDTSAGKEFEAVLFDVLHSRADLVLSASASILVVATVVYGMQQQSPPPQTFIRLMSYAMVALLGFMLPIVWIPQTQSEWMRLLRHMQTAAFNGGLFLVCAGLITLLEDLMRSESGAVSSDHGTAPSVGAQGHVPITATGTDSPALPQGIEHPQSAEERHKHTTGQ